MSSVQAKKLAQTSAKNEERQATGKGKQGKEREEEPLPLAFFDAPKSKKNILNLVKKILKSFNRHFTFKNNVLY